jgi:hypothetical protein
MLCCDQKRKGNRAVDGGRAEPLLIRFPCPMCGKRLKAPWVSVGEGATCRRCGAWLRVPNPPAKESGWFHTLYVAPLIVGVVSGIVGGVILAVLLLGLGLADRQEPPASEKPADVKPPHSDVAGRRKIVEEVRERARLQLEAERLKESSRLSKARADKADAELLRARGKATEAEAARLKAERDTDEHKRRLESDLAAAKDRLAVAEQKRQAAEDEVTSLRARAKAIPPSALLAGAEEAKPNHPPERSREEPRPRLYFRGVTVNGGEHVLVPR